MTQEQKELLLKDLCTRLSYGVKCYISELKDYRVLGSIQYDGINTLFDFWNKEQTKYEFQLYISEFKPYLFPLSSMSEEQKKEFNSYFASVPYYGDNIHIPYYFVELLIDFYNKHHFDWRGLIPKGLAIDATGLGIYENR